MTLRRLAPAAALGLTLLAAAPALAEAAGGSGAGLLAAWRWQQRPLVILVPAPDHPLATAQARVLAAPGVAAGLAERRVAVVVASGATPPAPTLRQRLGLDPGAARVLLIGLDGGVKLASAQPLRPQTLFATIDAMPMRQRELEAARAPALDQAPQPTRP